MTPEQVDEFLSEPRNAVMGTVRKDGSPQLSAIWFIYRAGKLYSNMYRSSAKYFNIRRDPRVVVCVNAAHSDARSVTIYGTAELIGEGTELFDWVDREMALQYHPTVEAAEAYLEGVDNEGISAVVVTPYKIISQDYN